MEKNTTDKIKTFFYIILALIAIGSAVFTLGSRVERYFAKTVVVDKNIEDLKYNDQLLNERLDISIIEDDIDYQQRQIQRIEDWKRVEQKTVEPELTIVEKEVLEKAKKEIERLEKERLEKKRVYEKRRESTR